MYTHYTSFFFKYIAPATEIINKFWAQVRGVINLIMFLCFLSACDSYESRVSFEFDCTQLHIESPPPICVSLCILRNSAKVRHNSKPTRRLLVEICPRCCLWQYMVMGHPFVELGNPGRRWVIFFLGAACSSLQATVNWRGSWFSWSMLIWGAQILCLRSDHSMMCFLCFLTSNTMFLSLLLHVSVLLFFISGARSLDETRWDVSSTWWRGVLLPSMKASGRRSIGLALPSTTRRGWARHGVNFVLGLQSDEPYES